MLVDVIYSFQTKLENLINNDHREILTLLLIYGLLWFNKIQNFYRAEFHDIGFTAFFEIKILYPSL